jgi:hypothetical protein
MMKLSKRDVRNINRIGGWFPLTVERPGKKPLIYIGCIVSSKRANKIMAASNKPAAK